MRRAQVQHIMIFVIGLVVISLILLFGYSTLENLNDDRCEIQKLQFGNNLQQAIERNTAWGTSTVVTLKAPCETEQVCFFDREFIDHPEDIEEDDFPPEWDIDGAWTTVVNSSLQTNKNNQQGDQTNIFTVTSQGNVEPVERYSSARAAIDVDEGSICADVEAEQLSVRLEGTGRAVKVIDVT